MASRHASVSFPEPTDSVCRQSLPRRVLTGDTETRKNASRSRQACSYNRATLALCTLFLKLNALTCD